MTDDQRIESIKKILHHMNKPVDIPQGLSREQYQKYKRDVLFDITTPRGPARAAAASRS